MSKVKMQKAKRVLTLKNQTFDGDILVVFQGAEKSHLLVSAARWADKQQYPAHDTGTGTSKGHHWHTWVTSWWAPSRSFGHTQQ